MKRVMRWAVCAGLASVLLVQGAQAELTVSVSISGSIDELLPLLRQLQDMGIGVNTGSSSDPLQLRVHSVMSSTETAEEPATAEPAPPAEPKPGFIEAAIQPASAKPGTEVLITAVLLDPSQRVDTVAVTIGDSTVDLFDNGTNGDTTAADGIWSRKVQVPGGIAAGPTVVSIAAFDVNGEPIATSAEGQPPVPWKIEAPITIAE